MTSRGAELESSPRHEDMNYAKHANAATLQHQGIFKHLGCLLGLNRALSDQDQNTSPCREPGTRRGWFSWSLSVSSEGAGTAGGWSCGSGGFFLSAGKYKWDFSLVTTRLDFKTSRAVCSVLAGRGGDPARRLPGDFRGERCAAAF